MWHLHLSLALILENGQEAQIISPHHRFPSSAWVSWWAGPSPAWQWSLMCLTAASSWSHWVFLSARRWSTFAFVLVVAPYHLELPCHTHLHNRFDYDKIWQNGTDLMECIKTVWNLPKFVTSIGSSAKASASFGISVDCSRIVVCSCMWEVVSVVAFSFSGITTKGKRHYSITASNYK